MPGRLFSCRMTVVLRSIGSCSIKTEPSSGGLARITARNGLKEAAVKCTFGHMSEHRKTTLPPPLEILGFPRGWRDEIKADLMAQLEAGGTLYGVRSDGAYVARTLDGEQVLSMPDRESA